MFLHLHKRPNSTRYLAQCLFHIKASARSSKITVYGYGFFRTHCYLEEPTCQRGGKWISLSLSAVYLIPHVSVLFLIRLRSCRTAREWRIYLLLWTFGFDLDSSLSSAHSNQRAIRATASHRVDLFLAKVTTHVSISVSIGVIRDIVPNHIDCLGSDHRDRDWDRANVDFPQTSHGKIKMSKESGCIWP